MTAKLTASADGSKVLIGNAAEDALEIDATAKTIAALAPYLLKGDIEEQLLAPNGYVKFASGLVIQWGKSAEPTAALTGTVTYPIPFPTGVTCIVLSPAYNAGLGGGQMFVVSNDASGFTWDRNDAANPKHLFWIALGF